METFYMVLTLSSLTTPNTVFLSHAEPWADELACVRALPRMEGAVARLIRYDASALELFGTITGAPPNPGSFVSAAECWPAEPRP